MKWMMYLAMTALLCPAAMSEEKQLTCDTTAADKSSEAPPWLGNYPISFFNKARSAKILKPGQWCASFKFQEFDADQRETTQGDYSSLPSGWRRDQDKHTFCLRYGLIENHMVNVAVPFLDNDYHHGTVRNSSSGVSNISIYDTWNIFKETETLPAVSVDFWYILPNGNPDRMLGTDDDAFRVTTEISKSWKDFSLHLNPGYKWDKQDGDNNEIEFNAAVLYSHDKVVWPVVEYNYLFKEGSGHSHDIVPGIIWKYRKGGAIKTALQFNVDSTMRWRDRLGMILSVTQNF